MEKFEEGLRCQDVHSGLRNIDPNSAILTPLTETQKIGMAASLAALVRGQDVVSDAESLRAVAAEQLDVSPYAFNDVIYSLEAAGFVTNIKRSSTRIVSFNEQVPMYRNMYEGLGTAWRDNAPTELEQQVVGLVDGLASAPIPVEELSARLGLDEAELPQVLDVATESNLARLVDMKDGRMAISPFMGFEHPDALADLVSEHGGHELADAFATLRGEQGIPLSRAGDVIGQAVAGGLLMAPSVDTPGGVAESFPVLPYSVDPGLLRERKPVLEKALAVIASLKCGEYYGGATSLDRAQLVRVINKWLDPNRGSLPPHSSHRRQYGLMHCMGMIRFDPDTMPGGSWVVPTFIDSADNRTALELARDLLTFGESVGNRVGDDQARAALALGSTYVSPMQTIGRVREKKSMNVAQWEHVISAAYGRAAL
ncbi:hypothetical protein AB1K56_13060 [Microbacterium sp. BWR-S6Y]|uniref:hypothetical protein n=1 Tax=Microbacterium sp. BWR-S6Y TaxID=3232073 RepID=UPI003529BED8